jgi:hypothetical protein
MHQNPRKPESRSVVNTLPAAMDQKVHYHANKSISLERTHNEVNPVKSVTPHFINNNNNNILEKMLPAIHKSVLLDTSHIKKRVYLVTRIKVVLNS